MKLVIFMLFLYSLSFAQVLDNSKGEAFTNKPFFNKTFVAGNKIKSIKGRFNYKKSGQAMYPTEYFYAYNFNPKGQLISSYETRKDDGSADTTWNEYIYDEQGLLIEHKQGNSGSKTSTIYRLDEKNRVVSEEYLTESIDSTGKKSVVLMNTETMTYENYGLQQKKIVSNSYGLPYKTVMSYYDESGYLLEQEERFSRTSNFNKLLHAYNEKGFLSSISTFQKGITDPVEEMRFKYDEYGNITEKHWYKNGIFTTDTQIIYNQQSKLMTAVIIRDVSTDFLMVIRFGEYEYY
jgi:YD repeat-containing protein